MRRSASIIACTLAIIFAGCVSSEQELTNEDQAAIPEALENPHLIPLFEAWGDPNELLPRFREGQRRAEAEWAQNQAALTESWNIGTTKTLRILPLADWHTSAPSLQGEHGVSYLITTDESVVLMDVGHNTDQGHPSPLLHNMDELGVTLDDFEAIVITHNHDDHVGGRSWSQMNSFSLTNSQIELGEKTVYTPVPMTYPDLAPIHSANPTRVSRGIATLGVISNALFFFGYAQEQALAVNVEGRGIVVITGCGHHTLPKLLERADVLFDEPIYGVVGGLHTSISDSRVDWFGVPVFLYAGTGRVPWEPITREEFQADIDLLMSYNPGVVAVSGHDSDDEAFAMFQEAAGDAFSTVRVGEPIVIGEGS